MLNVQPLPLNTVTYLWSRFATILRSSFVECNDAIFEGQTNEVSQMYSL
jgi:hypothetical protein